MSFIKFEKLFDFKEKKGYGTEEIRITEERLEVELPKTLKQLYLNYGKDGLINSDKSLVNPIDLNFDSENWLTIYLDSQGMCSWAINKNEFAETKCKVYCFWDEFQYEEDSSIENFLIKLGFYYSNEIFPFRLKTNHIESNDEIIISEIFGHFKSEIKILNRFAIKYFWSDFNELISIGGHKENKQIVFNSKNENQLFKFKKLFSKREWDVL